MIKDIKVFLGTLVIEILKCTDHPWKESEMMRSAHWAKSAIWTHFQTFKISRQKCLNVVSKYYWMLFALVYFGKLTFKVKNISSSLALWAKNNFDVTYDVYCVAFSYCEILCDGGLEELMAKERKDSGAEKGPEKKQSCFFSWCEKNSYSTNVHDQNSSSKEALGLWSSFCIFWPSWHLGERGLEGHEECPEVPVEPLQGHPCVQ